MDRRFSSARVWVRCALLAALVGVAGCGIKRIPTSGKVTLDGQPMPEGSRATDTNGGANFISRFLSDEVLSTVQRLRPLAEQAGLTMAQLAIAWVLQNPNVSSAIVGASRPDQLADNVKAAGAKLDTDLLKAIDEILDPIVERDPTKTASPKTRP